MLRCVFAHAPKRVRCNRAARGRTRGGEGNGNVLEASLVRSRNDEFVFEFPPGASSSRRRHRIWTIPCTTMQCSYENEKTKKSMKFQRKWRTGIGTNTYRNGKNRLNPCSRPRHNDISTTRIFQTESYATPSRFAQLPSP